MREETVICIAPRRWDGLWKETQAIMSRLAPANRVLYVEPGRDPERSVLAEMRRNAPNLFRLTIREVQQNLLVVSSPPVLPHARQHLPSSVLRLSIPLMTRINTELITMHVRRAIRALGIASPVLWLTDPYHAFLVGRFREKVACYLNFDEFAEMVENRRVSRLLRRLDDELTRRVDVVFTTSRAQCRRRQAFNARTHFVPNAVDFDLFARAVTEELPIPADIRQVPRPILGFVGWLTNHIDVALLRRVAEVYAQGSLVLVGPDQLPPSADLQWLRSRRNVVFLGRKEHAAVPAYLRMFDVALMPYRLTGHVPFAYPAKLHEYLAAGRAIVATALPELAPYHEVVRLARSDDEFVRLVHDGLADRSPASIEARLAVARCNTWDQRVDEVCAVLAPLVRRQRSPS
jgi:glycosyltransferase involved in cell wall biosynthesis